MESEKEIIADSTQDTKEGGTFKCIKCGLEEHYSYKGKRPPFAKKIQFLEESYVMRDPFSPPNKNQYLLLGSNCAVCGNSVCQSPDCSMFYTKRFCVTCAEENMKYFPIEVQLKIKKKSSVKNNK